MEKITLKLKLGAESLMGSWARYYAEESELVEAREEIESAFLDGVLRALSNLPNLLEANITKEMLQSQGEWGYPKIFFKPAAIVEVEE